MVINGLSKTVSGRFDERQFAKKTNWQDNLTKSKIQQIFVAKSTIRRNISIQFQTFCQIVLR